MSKWSGKLRKIILPLALAFNGAALPLPANTASPPESQTLQKETLWKTEYLDTVISLRECPDNNVCGYIYWVNPDDSRIFDYFGDRRKRFSASAFFPVDEIQNTTASDVLSVCGHTPKTDFHQVSAEKWRGTMELRGMNATVNIDVTRINDNELKVVSKLGIFSRTETWRRISPDNALYPKCTAPAAPK